MQVLHFVLSLHKDKLHLENMPKINPFEFPILFFDEKKGVIAAVHAGRNSTFLRIAEITAKKMIENFDCNPSDIKVVMGASIQKCCYEVNDELLKIVKISFGKEFCIGNNIDLQGINKMLLENIGIKDIEISPVCTKCSNKPYYSFRQNPKTGRFAGVIYLFNKSRKNYIIFT